MHPLCLHGITVTLRNEVGAIWFVTEPLSPFATLAEIVFNQANVDRHGSVVPYLYFEQTVQPYGKSLRRLPPILCGNLAIDLTVVFRPKEVPARRYFEQFGPFLNPDLTNMSFETFLLLISDPAEDDQYMCAEALMNCVFPLDEDDIELLQLDEISPEVTVLCYGW